ncbi:molybdopterin-dependent oxidoreductase [Halococcus sp. IIIV-5B]|uniref:molybdopterin-dependent oxidoreductase n=1 Tax=Halococcus sp. IIIV-5B TaxID=2321230 RepID=UPI000E757303|nr:molybdopterin-dependent oxidoreductase [Halococcus sp. IIIV-5B]RJT03018.1 sulfite oxidase [Halococcus sp. IIIV-5B]
MSESQRGSVVGWVVTALLAGVAGVTGSYALAGYTESFVAAPVTSLVTQNAPGALLQFAIGPLTTIGNQVGIEHLGQQANLVLAIGLGVLLFACLVLAALATGRRYGNRFVPVGLAGVLVWLAAAVLTGAPVTALGAGLGSAVVVGLTALAGSAGGTNEPVSGGRRSVLGSVAGVFGVGVLGYFLGSRGGESASEAASQVEIGNESSGGSRNATGGDAGGGNASGGSENGGTNASSGGDNGGDGGPSVGEMLSLAESKSLGIDGLEGLVSGDDFYQVDISNINPDVSADDWSLSVTGAVENEGTFTYNDITGMASENRFGTLRCVSDDLNGKSMDNAVWTGVPMGRVLDEAGLQGEYVMLRAADDYYQEFPVEALRTGFLAYGMDGEVLPQGHGYPVRALIPGHWGEINVKWLTGIEVLDSPAKGFWEKKGWHGTGPVNTVAKLHATNRLDDGRIQVGGHAYAGTRGIDNVEVSTDGGSSWSDATLSEVLTPNLNGDVWRQWEYTYDSPGESHDVVVRATDGTGTLQPKKTQKPFPSGATGWVSKTIDG